LSCTVVSDMWQVVCTSRMHRFNDDVTSCVITWACCRRHLVTVPWWITWTTSNHYTTRY